VALANVTNELSGLVAPDGQALPAHQELSLRVFVKNASTWRVAAFHNTMIAPLHTTRPMKPFWALGGTRLANVRFAPGAALPAWLRFDPERTLDVILPLRLPERCILRSPPWVIGVTPAKGSDA
jgi:hypothetical protein